MSYNIAIDGPAGAGKSTIAKKLAERLSFLYVDTGAMYRAMAYYFLSHHIRAEEEDRIREACGDISIDIIYRDGTQRVLLNQEDVSEKIRQEEVGNMASATSGYPFVRQKLLNLQRSLACSNDVIMDGRDIGTAILPDADLKIYLTASPEARAKRRYLELVQKNIPCDLEAIKRDIEERDDRDMHRKIAPLRAAEDARILDSSDMGIEEVLSAIEEMVRENRKEEKISGEPQQKRENR